MAARVTAHVVRVGGRWVWARVRQTVLDAAGWLRLAWQVVRTVARHAPRVAWWSGIGGWWLLTRSLWWCTAVADYADLVRQVRDDQRHGTAKRLRKEWTRAAPLRSAVIIIVAAVTCVVIMK